MGIGRRRHRRTQVLSADEVVDDDTLCPGSLVWLARSALRPDELARYDVARHLTTSRAEVGDASIGNACVESPGRLDV